MFLIDEEEVQAAFDVLHSNEHAKRRAAYEYAEKRLKVVLATALLAAEGKNADERNAKAQTSEEYEAALKHFRLISEAYYEARDKREAADAVTRAWQTQQSDRRAMRNAA